MRKTHALAETLAYGPFCIRVMYARLKHYREETGCENYCVNTASKASADLLVQAYHCTYGLPATISRSSNSYEFYQFPEKLIPLMMDKALADKPLSAYGSGLHVRDWLYVTDHCRAIDLILRQGWIGEVYNIGGHNEMRNIDIVRLICGALDKPESRIANMAD